MRLLVAEDDPKLLKTLIHIFEHNKFSVDGVSNGGDALTYAQSMEYDGLVLDIMMPRRDGLEVLRLLREKGVSTPVLLLTARSGVDDRIRGLNAGADDYLPKPFDMGELVARVRALTRRGTAYTPSQMTAGDLTLDRDTFELSAHGASVRLGNKEFQLLELLMRQRGGFLSTEQLMERIWGYESEAEVNVVWAYISYLRRKLEGLHSTVRITASRGRGYTLEVGA